jgi:hypothetical protein
MPGLTAPAFFYLPYSHGGQSHDFVTHPDKASNQSAALKVSKSGNKASSIPSNQYEK